MSIKIDRFEAFVSERGLKFTVDSTATVLIKDHSTDKIIGMVNLEQISDKNLELAELVIATIEEWVTNHEN